MASVNVPIFVESRYKINRKRIKIAVDKILEQEKIVTPSEVSIAVVGSRKMRGLNKKYRNIDKSTNVLSFPQNEGYKTIFPPDKLYLGDIVIAYPKVIEECARQNMLVDDWIDELVEHSVMHLLGSHHR